MKSMVANPPLDILALAPLPYEASGRAVLNRGVAVFYAELLPRLVSLGHHVRVLAEARPQDQVGEGSGVRGSLPGVSVEWSALRYHPGASSPPDAERARFAAEVGEILDREIGKRRPDVVLFGREPLAVAGVAACRRHGLPVALVCHGVALAELEEGRYGAGHAADLLRCLGQMDLVLAIARHIEERLLRITRAPVKTIRNAVDVGHFRPRRRDRSLAAQLGLDEHHLVVGHVSNLRPVKRPFDLVDAAAETLRHRDGVVFLLVGDGPHRAGVEAEVSRRGLSASFRFAGEIPHRAMPAYLNLCDVVLLTSEREGLPLSGLEAQACARVLLASDLPATREIVIDGETGALFPVGDVDAISRRLLELFADRSRRVALGRRARETRAREGLGDWASAYSSALTDLFNAGTRRAAAKESAVG